MKELKHIVISTGYSNVILLANGSNSILIDSGIKKYGEKILQKIEENKLQPTDIKLIILTHTHFDHSGNARFLKEKTGAQIVVHKNEKDWLEKGFTEIPQGTITFSRIMSWLGRNIFSNMGKYEPVKADIIVDDFLDLSPWNIDGKVLHTPGHTNGSISVITGNTIFAGDTFFNRGLKGTFPPFANNPIILLKTWQKLFDLGIKEIYPGHGPKFNVKKAFPELEKWKRKVT